MPDYTIQPVALDDDTTVTVSFSLVKSFDWKWRRILIIHYTGKYGWGSQGNPAAEHMNAMRIAGIERWEADGAVFDLTQLHYEWGDKISDALSPDPMAIVVGPHSRKGIASLFRATATIARHPRQRHQISRRGDAGGRSPGRPRRHGRPVGSPTGASPRRARRPTRTPPPAHEPTPPRRPPRPSDSPGRR